MTSIIIRILLLAVFIAHFAMPGKSSTVTRESAPFSDPSMACAYRSSNNG